MGHRTDRAGNLAERSSRVCSVLIYCIRSGNRVLTHEAPAPYNAWSDVQLSERKPRERDGADALRAAA
jgi:hypothetical protein